VVSLSFLQKKGEKIPNMACEPLDASKWVLKKRGQKRLQPPTEHSESKNDDMRHTIVVVFVVGERNSS